MNTAEIKDVLDILSEAGSARVREQLMVVLAQERESLAEKLGNVDRMILALNGNGAGPLPTSLQPITLGLEVLERAEANLRKPALMKVCQEPDCPRNGVPFEAQRKNARFCPECRAKRQSGWAARQKTGRKRGRRKEARV